MKVTRLRTNRMENPLGFWMEEIRFSCIAEEAVGKEAAAVRYQVSENNEFCAPVYDSGELAGQENMVCFVLPLEVKPRTRYYWRAWVRTDAGEEAWSEPVWFETSRDPKEPWQAEFIVPAWEGDIHPVIFRKIEIPKPVRQARAYILGLGVYELWLNGEKAGDEFLLPGLHAYDSWLQYQTFELKLRTGELKTSNQKQNRLFENIVWGQKGNFLDAPTDCPQRDERMGWTGDAATVIPWQAYICFSCIRAPGVRRPYA